MDLRLLIGILLPFVGTVLGAGCALFIKNELGDGVRRCLSGFAAGVMVTASIWSLILPAFELSQDMGDGAVIPVVGGFWIGIIFILILDKTVPHLHVSTGEEEGIKSKLAKTTMLVLAVTLHNIPEGMAAGVVFAGFVKGNVGISLMGALTLAVGIAIQNFPEGAIISLPLRSEGMPKGKAFAYGALSGIVEPIATVITILAADVIIPVLPYLLCAAAGAMMYVVVEELIPEMAAGEHSNNGTIAFTIGFTLMLVLEKVLG